VRREEVVARGETIGDKALRRERHMEWMDGWMGGWMAEGRMDSMEFLPDDLAN